jgi:hypothetical protein
MLIPRFTLRTILVITTVCAGLFLLLGMAVRGEMWAWGAAIGALSLGVAAVVHAACFGIVWCFSRLSDKREKPVATVTKGTTNATLLVVALALVGSAVEAQVSTLQSVQQEGHGFIVDVPSTKAFTQKHGFRLHIDSRWQNNFGYRPIRVEILAKKPTSVEHRFTIRLHVISWDRPMSNLSVEQDFDMPLGALAADTVIACPQFEAGQQYWWEIWVDGVKDKELSVTESVIWQMQSVGNSPNAGGALKFLIVGINASQTIANAGSDVFDGLKLNLSELPVRWIDYSAVDVVALSIDDLQQLAVSRPAALEAIGRWVRSGGQLWVHVVGDSWQGLDEVEELLKLEPTAKAVRANVSNGASPKSLAKRGWKPIKFTVPSGQTASAVFRHLVTGQMRESRDATEISELKQNPEYVLTAEMAGNAAPDQSVVANRGREPRDSGKWYVQHSAGLGYVRAFSGEWDPVGFSISFRMQFGGGPDQNAPMPTPVTAAMETTQNWEARHGMTPNTANEDFPNLLVPGVGLAPVTEFRVLITAFVVVMGPLNYWLLKRANRLHLMLISVPAVALVLTLGLFAYAFLSDGLSTQARVHSFTSLDQRSGEAATWSRISYYAGLAPARGLRLPADMALYPIIPGWNTAGGGAVLGSQRLLEWTEDGQRLTDGWLRSRTPTQYLTIRARKSPHRLDIQSKGDGRLAVANKLGTPIEFLAVVDEAGEIFIGQSIAAGAKVELEKSTHDLALRRIRQLVTEHRPETPAALEMEPTPIAQMQRRQQRRYYRNQLGMDYGAARLRDNLPNDAIAAIAGTNLAPVENLPPRSYFAVTEKGPEVELGVPVVEQDSFHVIEGKW